MGRVDMEAEAEKQTPLRRKRPFGRWFRVVFGLIVVVFGYIWLILDHQLQTQWLLSVVLGLVFFLILLVGWLVTSWRVATLWALLGGGLGYWAFSTYELVDVTGDLIPIVRKRGETESIGPSRVRPTQERLGVAWESEETPEESRPGFPQFMGPNRDGVLSGPELAVDWEAQPPEILWRRPIGAAYSGFAVSDEIAVTQEQSLENPDEELVSAYQLSTGDLLWKDAIQARYDSRIAGVGPRATPTISGGVVFALGAKGSLSALELSNGAPVWRVDLIADFGAEVPEWGFASSPLVVGDRVVVCAGGGEGESTMAFDVETGAVVWSAGDAPASWSAPMLATLGGETQILMFNQNGVLAHAIEDGRILWSHPWNPKFPNVSMPLVWDDNTIILSTGYGQGAERVRVARVEVVEGEPYWKTSSEWKSRRLKCKFGSLFAVDGFLYGLDDGMLTCIDPETGDRVWKDGRFGHGQALLVGQRWLWTTESGDLVLVEPDSEGIQEVARLPLLEDKTWNPPTVVGSLALVRNHVEAVALRLPLEE